MARPVARVGDVSSHLGYIVTGSPDVTANGLAVARAADVHVCPEHGIGGLIPVTTKTTVNGRLVITVGALTSCGAIILQGSPNVTAE